MALQYKYLDRPKDIDACLNLLSSTLVPLLKEHWDKSGKSVYNKEFSLNTEAFVTLWLSPGPILGYDELWLNTDTNKNVGAVKGFKQVGETSVVRFVRE